MNGIVKKWALALLGNYSIYFVYRREGGAESASATNTCVRAAQCIDFVSSGASVARAVFVGHPLCCGA